MRIVVARSAHIVGEVKPGRIWYILSDEVIRLDTDYAGVQGSSSKQLYSTVEGCIRSASPPAVFGSHGNP